MIASKSMEEAREKTAEFIEYSNKDRPQWTLKKMAPKEYRCHLMSLINQSPNVFLRPNFGVQFRMDKALFLYVQRQ